MLKDTSVKRGVNKRRPVLLCWYWEIYLEKMQAQAFLFFTPAQCKHISASNEIGLI